MIDLSYVVHARVCIQGHSICRVLILYTLEMFAKALLLAPLLLAGAVPTPAETQVLLVTRQHPIALDVPCAMSLGSYGSVSGSDQIYLASASCVESQFDNLASGLQQGSMIPLEANEGSEKRLFWLGEAGVEGMIRATGEQGPLEGVFEAVQEKADTLAEERNLARSGSQKVLAAIKGDATASFHLERLYQSGHSLIFSASSDLIPILDTLIPSHLSLVALPELGSLTQDYAEGVRKDLAENLANLTSTLRFSPKIDKILTEGMNARQLVRDIRWLTGEASELVSRHSFTGGARQAASWIRGKFARREVRPMTYDSAAQPLVDKVQATGAECVLEPFLPGFSPNVICTYPSSIANATGMTIMSAHYDSRGSFGRIRAPGGDDDGSGSGHLLGLAQAIDKMNVKFEKPVVLAFFAGEEQGLLGSHAYASESERTIQCKYPTDGMLYRTTCKRKCDCIASGPS